MKTLIKRALLAVSFIGLAYAVLLLWVWSGRTEIILQSQNLDEKRTVTVFGNNASVTVYSLDGDKYRHGLLPAANGALVAWANGETRPLLVAVHDHGGRDWDLRPTQVKPASWRPNISGRSPAFDAFMILELRSLIEKRFGTPEHRYLFGHSLGGFYALDMPTRQSRHGFAGLYAFSPTFSHDLSLIGRLGEACATSPHLYANIGLESGRDTDVFTKAELVAGKQPSCATKLRFSRHPGMLHQVVMLTGQTAAFFHIYDDRA